MGATREKIAILDCGAQYTKVIDRRVRELRVETEIFPLNVDPARISLDDGFIGVILSGGPASVYQTGAPQPHPALFKLDVPMLGICYGMQLMTRAHGGSVVAGEAKEYGETLITVMPDCALFRGLAASQQALMSHGDRVEALAPGFTVVAESPAPHSGGAPIIAAVADAARGRYGVQFHPEVELTVNGVTMLQRFLYDICGACGAFSLENRLETTIADIRRTVGDQDVFVLVSGGVDSSVTAALLVRALGPQKVFAVHIDSGLMRHQESDRVCEALSAIGLTHLRRMNAADAFFNARAEMDGRAIGPLSHATDPEEKRRLIGDTFYHLAQQAMREADCDIDRAFIAQGTLRPDLIESGNRDVSVTAQKIKTHHNDVPLIQAHRERGLILETNRDWHKDEVREIGRMLGLPDDLVDRQPFPGPGLGIRVLCATQPFTTPDDDAIALELDRLAKAAGYGALLLPVKSVGVQGDGRSYSHLALIDAGDAHARRARFADWQTLKALARQIPNHVHAVNRVAIALNGPALPAVCNRITPTTLTPQTVERLRLWDHYVSQAFRKAGLFGRISQLLAVLVPVDLSGGDGVSLAIRAVVTSDYMTARPAAIGDEIPIDFLLSLADELSALPDAPTRVFYDVTSKPPATVEWE
ncbi:MAG: glutamine-hydrolyzing GMP synthase [Vampirovibrionales bacterium]|nr:glutamine-hydrolyzing GMP synthase [Vampirovibrionales bacterium]